MRNQGVYLKFNPLPTVLKGKRVVVIDDSIVRGTTSKHLVSMLHEAGAQEVHMRITCPPIAYPCFMGVDMPTSEELIANNLSVAEIQNQLAADSLHFLSLDGMLAAISSPSDYCNACFTGNYPFAVKQNHKKSLEMAQLEVDKLA
jgi:amidophosphoribosyltransferase